ncbi:hypothetical protein BJX99DRAFT_255422 [Aspergillus californicus]
MSNSDDSDDMIVRDLVDNEPLETAEEALDREAGRRDDFIDGNEAPVPSRMFVITTRDSLNGVVIESKIASDIAWIVFDRYRNLKSKFQRGTGVWGRELDNGPLLIFEEFRVEHMRPSFRVWAPGRCVLRVLLGEAKRIIDQTKQSSPLYDLHF